MWRKRSRKRHLHERAVAVKLLQQQLLHLSLKILLMRVPLSSNLQHCSQRLKSQPARRRTLLRYHWRKIRRLMGHKQSLNTRRRFLSLLAFLCLTQQLSFPLQTLSPIQLSSVLWRRPNQYLSPCLLQMLPHSSQWLNCHLLLHHRNGPFWIKRRVLCEKQLQSFVRKHKRLLHETKRYQTPRWFGSQLLPTHQVS